MRLAVIYALEWVCGKLDRIPCYEQGRWYKVSGYGCRLGLGRFVAELDERWGTGFWQSVEGD